MPKQTKDKEHMGCCWGWFLLGCKTKPKVNTTHELFKGDTAAV